VVATRIGKSVRYLVAAPGYLKGRKLPVEPAELELHDCVMLSARNNETTGTWSTVERRHRSMSQVRYRVATSIRSELCDQ